VSADGAGPPDALRGQATDPGPATDRAAALRAHPSGRRPAAPVGHVRPASLRRRSQDLIPVPRAEEDAARQWAAQAHRQVRPARHAAAVLVVRDGPEGPELLLRHRPGQTPLGVVGLPGGSLTEEDADACTWYGPSARHWARRLGMADLRRARQHVVCAVRELFEETGLLLAGAREGEIVLDPATPLWEEARTSLEAEGFGLPAQLKRRGLGLRTDLLRPVGRWISPDFRHRRFDAIVFAAAVPPGQQPTVRPALAHQEHAAGLLGWVPAARLLQGPVALPGPPGWLGETGTVELEEVAAPPTLMLARRLAESGSAVAFLLGLADGAADRPLPTWHMSPAAEDGDRLWMRPTLA
jgi:8-oxo-dGTP pyrophosphatase MutT (NUDIX family)